MADPLETLTQTLRELVLAGAYGPDEKLGEVAVAERLGASRTPARLAMAALEKEGLLVREPNRGFRVRLFTIDEVGDAIEVRGELEAMAARLVAERGLDADRRDELAACLGQAEDLLVDHVATVEARSGWIETNADFHALLVEASGNLAVASSIEGISRLPLAGPTAIVFNAVSADEGLRQLQAAHLDHVRVFEAIERRQGSRAAAIMRDHAFRSGENKRRNFAAMQSVAAEDLPGLSLVKDKTG